MYEYLTGRVAAVTPAYVVLDVGGVGYRLLCADPYDFHEGAVVTMYVQLIIRENDQTLYGFATEEAKRTFNQLLSVTGIGPKSALAILANVDAAGLAAAIAQGDAAFLTKFPGVGKKTAQQIILDLKGKLAVPAAASIAEVPDDLDPALADALAALVALGYPEKAVAKVQPKLAAASATTTDAYLRAGLKLLSQ
ncbi:Holliday junction branch migration protein RuvA [Lacticaseibacillus yichunensis]|uniref:Holliday junction branch migration complex subunit RuvA n=1 Tax=Lacticaseibacillus yichunensis TaxID=2486015 RepID=A0ABW4CN01_9LACO|nr:Holliday junction branch migration protein RuvA [Lacticaseibacillus yichunensis]